MRILWAVLALATASGAQDAPAKKRFLVTFESEMTKLDRAAAVQEMGFSVADDIDALGLSVVESRSDASAQDAARILAHPRALTVEEDVYRNWLLDDPAELATSAGVRVPWGVARINAPAVWPKADGSAASVAVIDTGIDCSHPDLDCDYSSGANIVDAGADPFDDNDHGSHVAGTIAGRGISSGPLGVAPKARLIPVKVLDERGAGRLSDIIKGLLWAADSRVDVINMSLGGPIQSPALERAVMHALARGVVVVCAAGNSGPDANSVGYPAAYPGVIAVAASDRKDRVAPFSSRGSAVAFIAPGVGILSTIPGGGVKTMSGTSMAAPHVAGLAALAVQCGARGPQAVRRAFTAAASKLPGVKAVEQGAGMIDAAALCR